MHLIEALLLSYQLVGRLIELIHMVAQVAWGSQLEKVCVEGGHLGLDVVKQKGLDQVAPVNADRHLLEELTYGQVLGLDALLDQVDLVEGYTGCCALLKGFDCLLLEAEAVEGVQTVVGLAHIIDNED